MRRAGECLYSGEGTPPRSDCRKRVGVLGMLTGGVVIGSGVGARAFGVLPAEAVRALMPTFDLKATLASIEVAIVDAARKGRESVEVMARLPAYDGKLTPTFVADCRLQVCKALSHAGYVVHYDQGGHHGRASLEVSWGQ